ncbi:MAG: hypothetical protein ACXVMS_08750 [Flavisolibacter sp.]
MNRDLIETAAIENYLLRRLKEDERQQFKVKLLLDPSLAEKTESQAGVYKLVRRFWRRHTRRKLEHLYQQLLKDTSFAGQLH